MLRWMIAGLIVGCFTACPGEPEEEPTYECDPDSFEPYCDGEAQVYCQTECGFLLSSCPTYIRTRTAPECEIFDVGFDMEATDMGSGDAGADGGNTDLGGDMGNADANVGDMAAGPADPTAEVLAAVNVLRAAEQTCGAQTVGPVSALVASAELTSAAQTHADDMAANSTLSFEGSDGSNGPDRAMAAGFAGTYVNESISSGQMTTAEFVTSLVQSDGTCMNLMADTATSLGAGYGEDTGGTPYWSVVLGAE